MSVLGYISVAAIPTIVLLIILAGLINKVEVFDAFVTGAKEGIETTIKIIPPLVGLIVAVGVFRASGAMSILVNLLSPVCSLIGIPPQVISLALIRPVSGSASLAVVNDIMKTFGPDTYFGLVACTIMGANETIFYTMAVYYGSIGVKKIRYTLCAALIADFVAVILTVNIWRVL